MKRTPIYGIMAEFDSPTDLVDAAHRTYEAGYQKNRRLQPISRSKNWPRRLGFTKTACPWWC